MILKIFSVYDSKAESYMAPFYFHAIGQALRAFTDTANDTKSSMFKHAGDYTLYCIGDFDDQTGKVQDLRHVNLGKAIELQNKELQNGATIGNEPSV